MGFSDLPIYTQFHVAIGITAIIFASLALLSRLPFGFVKRSIGAFHPLFGGLYIILAIFMPITSNWIWPRFGTPWMVIFFISTMFISMSFGIIAIKVFKHINSQVLAYALVEEMLVNLQQGHNQAPIKSIDNLNSKIAVVSNEGTSYDTSNQNTQPTTVGGGTMELDSVQGGIDDMNTIKSITAKPRHVWLKYLHAFLMFYSYVMILGAAGAFSSNARTKKFPYTPKATDQLYGRCFGRNLNETIDGISVPGWLGSLQCGTGAWCLVSALGGENAFVTGHGQSVSDDAN